MTGVSSAPALKLATRAPRWGEREHMAQMLRLTTPGTGRRPSRRRGWVSGVIQLDVTVVNAVVKPIGAALGGGCNRAAMGGRRSHADVCGADPFGRGAPIAAASDGCRLGGFDPLDRDVKLMIAGQLDKAEDRFAAITD
jgi:hypothetical protein